MTGIDPAAVSVAPDPHLHAWSLRDVEYDAGLSLYRFECLDCGDVRYT